MSSWRLPLGIVSGRGCGGSPYFAFDAFGSPDGTLLTAHNAAWTKHAASTAATDPTTDNGRLHNINAGTTNLFYHSYTPSSADYSVSVDVVLISDNDLSSAGTCIRMDTTANTSYQFRYLSSVNRWYLQRLVAGTPADLQTFDQVLTPLQAYRAKLGAHGTDITLHVDGVLVASATDNNISAAGKAGIRLGNAATSSIGVHLDNWAVEA